MKIITLSLEELHQELGVLLDARFAHLLHHLRATQPSEAEYLTTQEALALMHLSKPTLYKLRREGRIASYNSSDKRVLFKRSELLAYLAAATHGGKRIS